MARLITSGFELQSDADAQSSPDGTRGSFESFVASPVHGGLVSAKWTGASVAPNTWSFASPALGTRLFLRAYFYVPTGGLPSAEISILELQSGQGSVRLETDGTLTLWALTVQQGSASAAISLDTWNLIELSMLINTGSVDTVEGRLGEVSFASATGLTISDSTPTSCQVGGDSSLPTGSTAGASFVMYADDVALNDSTGAAQNTWPGQGYVALLRPTADSAVGTGWTLGNTTATGGNAWSRLNKAPPDSAADLTAGADADQIRNATSNANSSYDATMKTYTAAGVTGTVNVVVPIIATGSPVVTSAKAGTVGVVSNPAIANVSLGAGGTSGAFWSGFAMGSYPIGNKWSFGTTTYAPTVTLGTAPVMRVTQVTSSTRIAIVTEMGIYVDYIPAVAALPPLPVYVDSAVARSTSY